MPEKSGLPLGSLGIFSAAWAHKGTSATQASSNDARCPLPYAYAESNACFLLFMNARVTYRSEAQPFSPQAHPVHRRS